MQNLCLEAVFDPRFVSTWLRTRPSFCSNKAAYFYPTPLRIAAAVPVASVHHWSVLFQLGERNTGSVAVTGYECGGYETPQRYYEAARRTFEGSDLLHHTGGVVRVKPEATHRTGSNPVLFSTA